MDAKIRFEQYVNPEALTGCWIWSGGYAGNNYPMFSFEGKATKASRLSHLFYKGHLDKGKYIRHLCHNPSCVNPAHLEQGTQKQNMLDSSLDGRLNQKLSNEDVKNILNEYIPYVVSLQKLANKYGVSKKNILNIVKGRIYKHLYGN